MLPTYYKMALSKGEDCSMSGEPTLDVTGALKPSKPEFIIAGHSHIVAMGAPQAYAGPASLTPVEACSHGYFLMERWHRMGGARGASYWDALVKHSEGRAAVLVYFGNQHFSNFLLARMPLFDFVDPMDPGHELYSGAVVVPRRMVKALPILMPGGLRGLILRLRAGGCRYVIVTGTPPVREDFGDEMDNIRKNELWRASATKLGVDIATCGFTPAPIMQRLWGVLQEMLADVARETGTRFLPVPNEAIDVNGYLEAKYRGPLANFTHANDAYGRLMLEHIVRAVSEGATESVRPAARSGSGVGVA
jgi:hypothetical protein